MLGIAIGTLVAAFLSDRQIAKTDTPHTLFDQMVREYARRGDIQTVKALRAQQNAVKAELWKQAPRRGTLWQTYSPTGAPRPGQRGYRDPSATDVQPHGYDGAGENLAPLAARLLGNARALMNDPEIAMLYSDATHAGLSDAENIYAWLELADYIGVPATGHSGRQLTEGERAGSTEFIIELAMETDPSRWGGTEPGGNLDRLLRQEPRYQLRGELPRPEPTAPRPDALGFGAIPMWLAIGILQDSMERGHGTRLKLVPVSREEAKAFIAKHHSKLPEFPYRTMYAIGAAVGQRLVAVATAGHPSGPWKPLKGPADRLKRIRKILNQTLARQGYIRQQAGEEPLDAKAWRRFSRSLSVTLRDQGEAAMEAAVAQFVAAQPEDVARELEGRLNSYQGRGIDQRNVLELTRVASDGTVKNAASMLTARLLDLLPVSGRGDPSQAPLFVTYQLTSEDGTTYRALSDRGLRPVAFQAGDRHKVTGGQRSQVKSLADVDKILWQAGPLATVADWPLLDIREGEAPAYSGVGA